MNRFATILILITLIAAPVSFADMNHMDMGGSLDIWALYIENTVDFKDSGFNGSADDQDDFVRLNPRLWFEADLADDVMVKIQLEADRAFEQFEGSYSPDPTSFSTAPSNGFGSNNSLDVFVEEAYMVFKQIYDSRITAKLGRLYMNYGDDPMSDRMFNTWWGQGFILSDAQSFAPQDLAQQGTIERDPFDTIQLTYDADTWTWAFGWAKSIENRNIDEDVDLWYTYYSYTGLDNHQIDGYATFNYFDGDGFLGGDDIRAKQYTIGLRAAGDLTDSFAYKAEAAYNFGDIENINSVLGGGGSNDDDGNISGFALQLGINFHPENDHNANVGFMYTFLEGDDSLSDSDNDDFDGFVSLFEGKVYGEIANAYIKTNAHVFDLNGSIDLREDLVLSSHLYYFLLDDDDNVPLIGQYGLYGSGLADDSNLGWEWDVFLDYMFNEEVSAQLAAGIFFPGDAIESSFFSKVQTQQGTVKIGELNEDDQAIFLRAGVKIKF
jgi:hypothetical protein